MVWCRSEVTYLLCIHFFFSKCFAFCIFLLLRTVANLLIGAPHIFQHWYTYWCRISLFIIFLVSDHVEVIFMLIAHLRQPYSCWIRMWSEYIWWVRFLCSISLLFSVFCASRRFSRNHRWCSAFYMYIYSFSMNPMLSNTLSAPPKSFDHWITVADIT